MKIGTQVALNKSYQKIILKIGYHGNMMTSTKYLKIRKNRSFIQTALTLDLKDLKGKRIIFNINSGFYIGINI